MDDQDPVDEELGQPDPEATGQVALEQLGQDPGVASPADVGAPQLPANMATNPPAAMPVVPPPQVPQGDHATKGTRTVEGLVPAPDLVAGQAKEQQVIRDEKKLAGDQAGLEGERARIEQEQAEKVADETARQNAQIQAEQQYQMEQQQARQAQYAADIEKLRAQKPPGGFTEWAGGKRAAAMVSMAIGGLVSGRAGTANTAIQDVDRQVAQEQQAWTNEQHRQLSLLNERKGLNHDMDAAGKDILAQAEARKVLALDSLSKRADAQLKALGIPAAQQVGIKAQLGLDQKAAEAQQKYGQILSSKVTDATQFAPGRAGAGGGGGQSAVINLVKMAEDGAKRSEIVAAAAKARIPEKAWKNQVDLAFSEREKGLARKDSEEAKKASEDEKRAVRDPSGTIIGYAGGARPDVKGLQDRFVNFESAEDFLKTLIRNKDHLPVGSDWHNGVLAIAATTTANPSDATTKHEAGTLKGALGLIDQDAVKTKLADIQKRKAAFMRQLRPVEGGGEAAEKAPAVSGAAPEGTVIVGPGGKTKVKQGGKWVDAR